MLDRGKQVETYVLGRLKKWSAERNEGRVKAELANLRRGVGCAPGDLPELWGVLFDGFPEELMSRSGEPTWAEWAASAALTLYAVHQQGRNLTEQSMYARGASLGGAVRRLVHTEDDLERVRRRFNAFATSGNMAECAHHLRGLIHLLRAEGIPLDYPELARDLYQFQTEDGAPRVRLRWGQDFYRRDRTDESEMTNGEDDSNVESVR